MGLPSPIPLLGFPHETLYGDGQLYECRHKHKTFFVEKYRDGEPVGSFDLFVQPDRVTYTYDNLLLVVTKIHELIKEIDNADDHRQADPGAGENVERHAECSPLARSGLLPYLLHTAAKHGEQGSGSVHDGRSDCGDGRSKPDPQP